MRLIKRFCTHEIIYQGSSEKILFNEKPVILSCWHSRFMVLFAQPYGSFYAITSAHKDGNYLQMILEYYGHKAIRGSSRNKANNAMREILKIDPKNFRLVVTPDGPIGPRFKIKGNVVNVAKKFKVPILPVSYSATHAKVLKTWDRFLLPIPFLSKIVIIVGKPLDSQKMISDSKLEKLMMVITKEADKMCSLSVDY